MKDNEVRLDHDDNAIDVVDKINEVLRFAGWELVDDEQLHDGFVIYRLEKK